MGTDRTHRQRSSLPCRLNASRCEDRFGHNAGTLVRTRRASAQQPPNPSSVSKSVPWRRCSQASARSWWCPPGGSGSVLSGCQHQRLFGRPTVASDFGWRYGLHDHRQNAAAQPTMHRSLGSVSECLKTGRCVFSRPWGIPTWHTQRQAKADAPPFEEIAKRPTFSDSGLTTFLLNPHAEMPDMNLTRIEAGDIAAYVAKLR